MYGRSNPWVKDLVGVAASVGTGYLGATMAKWTGKPLTSALATTGAGVVGVIAKKMTGRPLLHEAWEGVGYGGTSYFGTWLAANTTTLGNKPAGAIPLQDVAASSAGAAAIAAARAAAARAGGVRRAGAASFPPVTTTPPLMPYRHASDLTEAV